MLKNTDNKALLDQLRKIVSMRGDRTDQLKRSADLLKQRGGYRWVGLYDVDRAEGLVRNVVWSGPGAPEYPTFPIGPGLTGTAIANRETVNVGDVTSDARYLTAFGSTRSEIIVPVIVPAFDDTENVAGTIDIESEMPDAFDAETQVILEACADVISPLWRR